MRDLGKIKKLVGNTTEKELEFVDCYVNDKIGIFIPSMGKCGYAARRNHIHPAYMVCILLERKSELRNHYYANIISPNVAHNDYDEDYYCVFIDKSFFESVYLMYREEVPVFDMTGFDICSDVLKSLNSFAFEYSKHMRNSDITLDAQSVLLTHWIVRSIIGENIDMRAVSQNHIIARIQQYIEFHYGEELTVLNLAAMANMSPSTLNRSFNREFGMPVMKYVFTVRIEKAKLLLRRTEIPLVQIAHECGFGSSSHFAQLFKSSEAITPTQYRKSYER